VDDQFGTHSVAGMTTGVITVPVITTTTTARSGTAGKTLV
jgi:hypothetical protein